MLGVPQEQRAQVLDAGPQPCPGPRIVPFGPGVGQRVGHLPGRGPSDPVLRGPQLDGPGFAGSQFELPAQQPRRGQRVVRRRLGGGHGLRLAGAPAQPGGMHPGGQLRPRLAGGHGGQLRQVGAEQHLHGQADRPGRETAQGDPLGAVRVPDPFHTDVGVGARLGAGAHGRGEDGPVRSEAAPLHRDRLPAADAQYAAGEQAAARSVDPVDPLSRQLAVLRGDDQTGGGDADDGAVHGRQFGPAGGGHAGWAGRCGMRHVSPCLRSGRFSGTAGRPGPHRPPAERPRPRPGHGP